MKPVVLIPALAVVAAAVAGGWWTLRPAPAASKADPSPRTTAAAPAPTAATAAPSAADPTPTSADRPGQPANLPLDDLAKRLAETLARAEADRQAGKAVPQHAPLAATPPVRSMPQPPPPRKRPTPPVAGGPDAGGPADAQPTAPTAPVP
jgi:hypothetical protein